MDEAESEAAEGWKEHCQQKLIKAICEIWCDCTVPKQYEKENEGEFGSEILIVGRERFVRASNLGVSRGTRPVNSNKTTGAGME